MSAETLATDSPTVAPARDSTPVLSVKHWSESLFSFEVERPDSLRFRSGEFVMLGLTPPADTSADNPRPILRAYSIASPAWGETLEFYSIKVADGLLTSRLQHISTNDYIILKPKPVGTLVMDALTAAKNLWLFATGTGIAPFMSIVRDPETYEKFEHIRIVHTCRTNIELAYAKSIISELATNELLADTISGNLSYMGMTTREHSEITGRSTEKIKDNSLYQLADSDPLDVSNDRVMICGSLSFNKEMIAILQSLHFCEGTDSKPGQYVVEKAFVD